MIRILAELLMPPMNILLLATLAVVVGHWQPRLGRQLMVASLIAGYVLCTPVITGSWLRYLESRTPPQVTAEHVANAAGATAIVVLGSGSYFSAPEYGSDTVSESTLVRLRWAARLHRQSKLPVLVSGGSPYGNTFSEAEQMRDALATDFATPVRWIEAQSRNTYEAAHYTMAVLGEQHTKIVLVTHAAHMPRAGMIFKNVGFDVIAAPTGYTTSLPMSVRTVLPSAAGLRDARIFFYEIIGIGWYYLRLAGDGRSDQT